MTPVLQGFVGCRADATFENALLEYVGGADYNPLDTTSIGDANVRKLAVVLLALCLVATVVWARGSGEGRGDKVLVNGIDPDFPPFGFVDQAGNAAGFDVESVNWIAKEMGFEVKHQPTAWDGIIESLRSGKIDFIASGMTILPERAEVVNFTIPYWETKLAVAVGRNSNLSYDQALGGQYTIGVQRGTTAANWIEDNLIATGKVSQNKVVLYDSFSLALQDLANGRIDSAMQDDTMVLDAAKSQPIKVVGTHKSGMQYGYAVRKEDAELLEALNEGLRKLMASDKWKELVAKYELEAK
jgi:polar amino acid transport system substrate-binding protein